MSHRLRLIHAGDTHLGAIPAGKRGLGEDIHDFVDWLGDEMVKQDADLVILAGDTFDSASVSPTDLAPLLRLIARADDTGRKVAIVDGNHDSMTYSRTGGKRNQRRTTWSESLRSAWPKTVLQSFDPAAIRETGFRMQGIRGISIVPLDYAPGPIIRDCLEFIQEGQVNGLPSIDILVCHQSAAWATGGIFETDLEETSLDGIASYAAVGDIHKAVTRDKKGGMIAYSGPSTWIKEPESGQEGVWVVDLGDRGDDGKIEIVKMSRKSPVNVRNIVEVEIRRSESGTGGLLGHEIVVDSKFRGQVNPDLTDGKVNDVITEAGSRLFGNFTANLETLSETFPERSNKSLLRVLYPHDSETVDRKKAVEFGEAISFILLRGGEGSVIVVADPVDGRDVAGETDMTSWVRESSGDESGIFTDKIVEKAIEESSLEVSADDAFSEVVAGLAKEMWKNPGGVEAILKNV